ncbi:hypothetical protein TNCV_370971 [Trichonephila clavipes]|nr:hypothetical protein TNCV_370971 [Trichonephila clavipes]
MSHQARMRRSEYCMENRDSYKKTTLCHSSNQMCHSVSLRLCLSCIIQRSRSIGCRENSPPCCKRRRTIRADSSGAVNTPIFGLCVRDVVIRFCRADLKLCLSSRTLVIGGCGGPTCCSV